MLKVTTFINGGTRDGLTLRMSLPDEFTRWRREEGQDAGQREKKNMTQSLGWGEEARVPTLGKPSPEGG